jgi:hypothetical protein
MSRLWKYLWKRKAPSSPLETKPGLEKTPLGIQIAIG